MFILFNLRIKMNIDQEKLIDKFFREIPFSKKTRDIRNGIKTIYIKNIMLPIKKDKPITKDSIKIFVDSIINNYDFDNKKQEEIVRYTLENSFSNEDQKDIIDTLFDDIEYTFEFINPILEEQIKILYSDGSFNTSTKVGGYGVCELLDEDIGGNSIDILTGKSYNYKTYSGHTGEKTGTNNIGELMGIGKSLDIINNSDDHISIIISDSEYSIKSMREWIYNWKKNGWRTYSGKPIKNKELIKEIFDKIPKDKPILFCWTKAHVRTFFNEQCDILAKDSVGI